MDKLAQRRGKIQEFTEKLNLPGKMLEKFSPEFQELMEKLREVDTRIREIATVDEEGNSGGETLKDLLKVAKTNFNRREYITAIAFLGKFHDRLDLIDQELSKLKNSVDVKHHEFLFGNLDPSHLSYLSEDLGKKFEKARKTPTGILSRASLGKEASVTDWWHNITSDRGKALSAWEKRFPKYVKDLKNQTSLMINKSESLLTFMLSTLKVMSSLRNGRKLEEYLKTGQKLQEKFKGYNVAFIQFYNTYVKHFLDYQKSMQGATPGALPEMTGTGLDDTQISSTPPSIEKVTPDDRLPTFSQPPPAPISSTPLPFPTPFPSSSKKDSVSPESETPILSVHPLPSSATPSPKEPEPFLDLRNPVIPKPPLVPREFQQTMPSARKTDPYLFPEPKRADHSSFLQALAEMEDEHPMVIATRIIGYAKSIEANDQETSQRLLIIAQNVLKG